MTGEKNGVAMHFQCVLFFTAQNKTEPCHHGGWDSPNGRNPDAARTSPPESFGKEFKAGRQEIAYGNAHWWGSE